jgi:hypothetical protein
MEQSEFKPPARQSLTDEQISAHLGAAAADEAGMLAAMEFLESQTVLREQDNQATAQWLERMKSSSDPRAALAVTNFERAKQGLEPLAESTPEVVVPEVVVPEVQAEEVIEPAPEPVVPVEVSSVESFEALISDAEPVAVDEPAVEPSSETEIDETVADQSAIEKPVTGFRMVSASNHILSIGVFAPILAAIFANQVGMNFVTSVLAGVIGIAVGVLVNVLGLITARRTHRGLAVAARASFGVFGSILPSIFLVLAGLFSLAVVGFGSAHFLDGRIDGAQSLASPLFSLGEGNSVSLGSISAVILSLLVGVLAIFGGKFSRVLKISLALIVLGLFLFVAISTTPRIQFLELAGVFQMEEFLVGMPVFALLAAVLAYGVDGESISIASWGATKKRLGWPIFIFGAVLPLLVFSHVAALFNLRTLSKGEFAIDFLLSTGGPIVGTAMLYLGIFGVIGLLYTGLMKLIEALKTLGVNHVGYGLATLVVLVFTGAMTFLALFSGNPTALSLSVTALLLIPAAAWIGAVVAETLLRRGKFHDASLTRSYGFYGSVNWIAMLVFVLSVGAALVFAKPMVLAPWLGTLSAATGFSMSIEISALFALGVAFVSTLLTTVPRILRQQAETRAVEERRFDLVDVVVD